MNPRNPDHAALLRAHHGFSVDGCRTIADVHARGVFLRDAGKHQQKAHRFGVDDRRAMPVRDADVVGYASRPWRARVRTSKRPPPRVYSGRRGYNYHVAEVLSGHRAEENASYGHALDAAMPLR